MAIRFSGSGTDYFDYTASSPNVGTFTLVLWAYLTVDRNDISEIIRFRTSGDATVWWVGTNSGGVELTMASAAVGEIGVAHTMGVGSWTRIAVTNTGGTGTVIASTPDGNTGGTVSGSISTTTAARFSIGARGDGTEGWNGRLAGVKMWQRVLNMGEIREEWTQQLPVSTAGLWDAWLLNDGTTTGRLSNTGSGRMLGSGATAIEDGPPIPRQRLVFRPWLLEAGAAATTASAGHASGTGAANAPTVAVTATAGHAAGSGTAHSPTVNITPPAGHAAGTGTAHDATIAAASNASAGHASGTGAALDATVNVTPPAGHASGTGAAFAPTVAVTATAGHAAGTGAAFDATINVTATAGHAAGTGTAHQPAVQADGASTATAGHAAGTGTAHSPTIAVVATAGHAAGTGAAHDATPAVAVTATAGHAAGTGTAHDATAAVVATAGHAAGTGTAYQPTANSSGAGDTTASAGHASGTGRAYDPIIVIANARRNQGWAELTAILREARMEQRSAFDAERMDCPQCGIRYTANSHGELGCRFDGRRGATIASASSSGPGRRAAQFSGEIAGWGPTN